MQRAVSVMSLIGLLTVVSPASAKPKALYYKGKTERGNAVAFSLQGSRIFAIHGYVNTMCVPTKGTPRPGSTEFSPPGSFTLGRTRKVSDTHYVSWWGDTTFNYNVSLKKRRGSVWLARLHVNYSYVQFLLPGGGQVDRTVFVCQGDDSFIFSV